MTLSPKTFRSLTAWMQRQGVKSFSVGDVSVTFTDEAGAQASRGARRRPKQSEPERTPSPEDALLKKREDEARAEREALELLYHSSG